MEYYTGLLKTLKETGAVLVRSGYRKCIMVQGVMMLLFLKFLFTPRTPRTTLYAMLVAVVDSLYVRGPFERFVDSPYYSESELCGGAVTVSFSKYLPW
jgi:hypothetical protein